MNPSIQQSINMKLRITKTASLLALATLLVADTAMGQRTSGGRTSGGGGSRGSGSSAALQAQNNMIAVADERSNSLIIIAPEDQIPGIEDLIKELDTNVDDITEVKVFKLVNADPAEMSEQINQLFGDQSQTQGNQTGSRFGSGFTFGRFGGGTTAANNNGARQLRSDQKVTAVADPRTASLIVSAPRQMMTSIEQMVNALDASPAKRQKVFIFDLQHADVNSAAEIIRTMFEDENASTRTTQTQQTALQQRQGSFGTAGATSGTIGAATGGAGGGGGRR
jgi:type II secretory pathway component GspD/PulD (secretin)